MNLLQFLQVVRQFSLIITCRSKEFTPERSVEADHPLRKTGRWLGLQKVGRLMNLDRKWKKGFETAKIFEIVRLFYIKHSKPKKTTKITKFRNWSLECPLAVVCCLQLVVGHVLLVVSKI